MIVATSASQDEMLVLIKSATRMFYKLGDLPVMPRSEVVERVRDDLFETYIVDGVQKGTRAIQQSGFPLR